MTSKKETHVIGVQGAAVEFHVPETLLPSVLRAFAGTTHSDAHVDNLPMPVGPLWLRAVVVALRCYRRRIAPHLGQRCVFEPSCSRYAELAFREKGITTGVTLTAKRLWRCRPGRGGVDLP